MCRPMLDALVSICRRYTQIIHVIVLTIETINMRTADNVRESENKVRTLALGTRRSLKASGSAAERALFFTGDLEPAVSRAGAISRLPLSCKPLFVDVSSGVVNLRVG